MSQRVFEDYYANAKVRAKAQETLRYAVLRGYERIVLCWKSNRYGWMGKYRNTT